MENQITNVAMRTGHVFLPMLSKDTVVFSFCANALIGTFDRENSRFGIVGQGEGTPSEMFEGVLFHKLIDDAHLVIIHTREQKPVGTLVFAKGDEIIMANVDMSSVIYTVDGRTPTCADATYIRGDAGESLVLLMCYRLPSEIRYGVTSISGAGNGNRPGRISSAGIYAEHLLSANTAGPDVRLLSTTDRTSFIMCIDRRDQLEFVQIPSVLADVVAIPESSSIYMVDKKCPYQCDIPEMKLDVDEMIPHDLTYIGAGILQFTSQHDLSMTFGDVYLTSTDISGYGRAKTTIFPIADMWTFLKSTMGADLQPIFSAVGDTNKPVVAMDTALVQATGVIIYSLLFKSTEPEDDGLYPCYAASFIHYVGYEQSALMVHEIGRIPDDYPTEVKFRLTVTYHSETQSVHYGLYVHQDISVDEDAVDIFLTSVDFVDGSPVNAVREQFEQN